GPFLRATVAVYKALQMGVNGVSKANITFGNVRR
ncbi:MAG: hypothetical protein JWQ08_2044, partial [Deinococcus sp.]|nr:hypothetical protein [Deinococcus sp.]